MSRWKNWDFVLYINSLSGASINISQDIDVESYSQLGGVATTSNFDLEIPSITLKVIDHQTNLTYASSYRELLKKYKNLYLEIYYDNFSKKIFRGYLDKNSIKTQNKKGFYETKFTFLGILASLDKKIINQSNANLSEIDEFVNNVLNVFPSTETIYELDVVELPSASNSWAYIKCEYNPDLVLPKNIPETSGILQLGKELLSYQYYDVNPDGKEDVDEDGLLENVIYFYAKDSYDPNSSPNNRKEYSSTLETTDIETLRILKILYHNNIINNYYINVDTEFLNKYISTSQEGFTTISQNRCGIFTDAEADTIQTQAFKNNKMYELVDYDTVGIESSGNPKDYSDKFDDNGTDLDLPLESDLTSYSMGVWTSYKYSTLCPAGFKSILSEDTSAKIEYLYYAEEGTTEIINKEYDYYMREPTKEKKFLDFITTCDDSSTYYYICRDFKATENKHIYPIEIWSNDAGDHIRYLDRYSTIYRYVIRDSENNVKKIISTAYWIPTNDIKFFQFGSNLTEFKLLWLDVNNSNIKNISFNRRPIDETDTVLCNVLYKDGSIELYEVLESSSDLVEVETFLNNNTLIESDASNFIEFTNNNGCLETTDSITGDSLYYITAIENNSGDYTLKKLTFNSSGYGNSYNNEKIIDISSKDISSDIILTGFKSIHLLNKTDVNKLKKIQFAYDVLDLAIENKKATEILNFFRKFHLAMLNYNLKNDRLEIVSFSKMFEDYSGSAISLNNDLTEETETKMFNSDMIEISEDISSEPIKQYFQNYKMLVFDRYGELRTIKTNDLTDIDYFDFIEYGGIVGVVIGKKIENENGVATYYYQTLTFKQPFSLIQARACGVML